MPKRVIISNIPTLQRRTTTIRIGDEYQANITPFTQTVTDVADREPTIERPQDVCLWVPDSRISDEQLEEYLQTAKNKNGYSTEQSLAMLMWHDYDSEKALADIENFQPTKEIWTDKEKRLFHAGYNKYGNELRLIWLNKFGPKSSKSLGHLVEYFFDAKSVFPEPLKRRKRTAPIVLEVTEEPSVLLPESKEKETEKEELSRLLELEDY